MAHILNSVMGTTTVESQTTDDQGNVHTAETTTPVVKQVTFMLDKSTPHTLTFLDKGTKVVDGKGVERTVGEGAAPHYQFGTPEEAVQAYLDGKV